MLNELQARFYKDGDELEIVKLLRLIFEDWTARKKPIDFWRWKYQATPLGSSIALVTIEDKLAGIGHRLNYRIKIGEKVLKSHYGDDFATHPDFRGRGVYNKVLNVLEDERHRDGVNFLYTITTNPIVMKDNVKMGRFDLPQPLLHMILVKQARSGAQAGLYLYGGLKRLKNPFHSSSSKPRGDYLIETIMEFNGAFDKFYERIKDSYDFIVERNTEFLNWRYCDIRGGKFLIKQARRGDEVLGYIVLEVKTKGGKSEGYIIDMLTEDDEVATSLLKDGINSLADLGVGTFNYRVVKNHPYQRISQKLGFVSPPNVIDMHVYAQFDNADEAKEALLAAEPSHIHFNYGDYF